MKFFTYLGCLVIGLTAASCGKKSDSGAATTQTTAAPQPAPIAPAPAATPSKPVPSFSAAKKVGLYAFPNQNQSKDQQLIDEGDCYDLAQQETGINPEMQAPRAPSSGEVQAAEAQAAQSAPQAQGGRVRGAARGAAGGAMIGAISGNAGRGAAVGATVGTVRGGVHQRQTNAAAQQDAANQAGAQVQQQYQSAKSAYNQKIGTFKRAFSACLTSRGFSVQ